MPSIFVVARDRALSPRPNGATPNPGSSGSRRTTAALIGNRELKPRWAIMNSCSFVSIRGWRKSNIAPVMTLLEVNAGDRFICACVRALDGCSEGSNRENPTAGSHNSAIRAPGSGMENLYVIEFRRFAESRNGFAGFVFVWVAARSEHNRDRWPLVPLDSAALDPAVDRRFQ